RTARRDRARCDAADHAERSAAPPRRRGVRAVARLRGAPRRTRPRRERRTRAMAAKCAGRTRLLQCRGPGALRRGHARRGVAVPEGPGPAVRWCGRCPDADEPVSCTVPLHHPELRIRSGRSRARLLSSDGEPVLTKKTNSMVTGLAKRWRSVLPWVISAALLFYVFGYATNWARLIAALEDADVPRFLLFAAADRLAFFTAWAWLSASALRRFVANVPIASVLAIRGGSELARAVSNPLADAAYALGLMQLCGGRLDAVIASALIPGICHYFVMLVQMTIALPLQ